MHRAFPSRFLSILPLTMYLIKDCDIWHDLSNSLIENTIAAWSMKATGERQGISTTYAQVSHSGNTHPPPWSPKAHTLLTYNRNECLAMTPLRGVRPMQPPETPRRNNHTPNERITTRCVNHSNIGIVMGNWLAIGRPIPFSPVFRYAIWYYIVQRGERHKFLQQETHLTFHRRYHTGYTPCLLFILLLPI